MKDKLLIATDEENPRWLNYIVNEFARIERARFDIVIVGQQELTGAETNVLFYTKDFLRKPALWNCGRVSPVSGVEYRENDVFIIPGTAVSDDRYALPYDALWNAFVQLSRMEEWQTEKSGKKIHSYASRHPRRDKTTFAVPVVNHYFRDLKRVIQTALPELVFESPRAAEIEWTHDLDYITKTLQLRLKQSAFNKANMYRSLGTREFFPNLQKTVSFLFSSPSYWRFAYWENIEKMSQIRSTFFIYSRINAHKDLRSWLLDPSYDVAGHQKLRDELKRLKREGFDIGLHGSYASAEDANLLRAEKDSLERALGFEIRKGRQHWLRYVESKTPDIHESLLEEDYTLGWNDRPGFRAGCASAFHPYDHSGQRPYRHVAIPQVLMDSHAFDYGHGESAAHEMVKRVLETPNARASVSWHPRTCSEDYGWHGVYERLLTSNALPSS